MSGMPEHATMIANVGSWESKTTEWRTLGAARTSSTVHGVELVNYGPRGAIAIQADTWINAHGPSGTVVLPFAYPGGLPFDYCRSALPTLVRMQFASLTTDAILVLRGAAIDGHRTKLNAITMLVCAARASCVEFMALQPTAMYTDETARYGVHWSAAMRVLKVLGSGASAQMDLWITRFHANRMPMPDEDRLQKAGWLIGPALYYAHVLLEIEDAPYARARVTFSAVTRFLYRTGIDIGVLDEDIAFIHGALLSEVGRVFPSELVSAIRADLMVQSAFVDAVRSLEAYTLEAFHYSHPEPHTLLLMPNEDDLVVSNTIITDMQADMRENSPPYDYEDAGFEQ